MSGYFDRNGVPMSQAAWMLKFNDWEYKRVAVDEVGGVTVSTVWLGLNHQWGDGPPHIFESMVFGGEFDQDCDRYSTEAEALAGHARFVERVRAGAKA